MGVGFQDLLQRTAAAAVGFEGLRQCGAAGDGVQTGGGGQRSGGGGTLLHCGAYVGRGFQLVSWSGGEVPNALDPLAELAWRRN